MKAVGEPDAGKPPVRCDEEALGSSRALLYFLHIVHIPVYLFQDSRNTEGKGDVAEDIREGGHTGTVEDLCHGPRCKDIPCRDTGEITENG